VILASVFAIGTRGAFAADGEPLGPDRYAVVDQVYISHEWWLTSWASNKVACTLEIDHEGLPTGGDILTICGQDLYDAWHATGTCAQSQSRPAACSGYYLVLHGSEPAERQVAVMLPPPVAWVTLEGCVPHNSTFRCDGLPVLVLAGEEPLSGETITGLAGRIDGRPFECDPVCQVDLAPTDLDGLVIEFWANSSYGDSSELFTARVRVAGLDDPADPAWYVDVLSSQWRGDPLAGCSATWAAFPPVGGVPAWLSTPQRPEELATNIPYEYLAANLIEHGIVDASACGDGGLFGPGLASACGFEAARPAVAEWQNRFDSLIFSAAQEVGIPAQLLKSIFSRESQFWPGISPGKPEAGLGQLTEGGADTTLLWNHSYYEQFCPTVLDDGVCRRGYSQLQDKQQDLLRVALVDRVDAFCADCPLGIDLDKADRSVEIFAQTLLANCDQAGMIVYNTFNAEPGAVAAYEDLWRFALVNYNAGPGCLILAVEETVAAGEPLDWPHLSTHLTPVCQGAADYVADVSGQIP
jgi:hypothetical protein